MYEGRRNAGAYSRKMQIHKRRRNKMGRDSERWQEKSNKVTHDIMEKKERRQKQLVRAAKEGKSHEKRRREGR